MSNYAKYNSLGKEQNSGNSFNVMEIESLDSRRQVITGNRVCVIDNYTEWCGPCKQIASRYATLAEKFNSAGKCILVKENLEFNKTGLGNHPVKIQGVPCFHFYVNGSFVNDLTVTGADLSQVEKNLQLILQ